MGQIDSATDAALAQLQFEELSSTPGGEFAEIIGDLLSLVGANGPWAALGGAPALFSKVRKLAGASYANNLIYAISAVRSDLRQLLEEDEAMRQRIDALPSDEKFAEAISALALHAMHTSVKERLARLARIVVNGVKEGDLEIENLDDMMRAAAELMGEDIVLLGKICDSQKPMLMQKGLNPTSWYSQVPRAWDQFVDSGALDASKHLFYRSSFSRLESHGFVQKFPKNFTAGVGLEPYALLQEGMKFYEHLQEISMRD